MAWTSADPGLTGERIGFDLRRVGRFPESETGETPDSTHWVTRYLAVTRPDHVCAHGSDLYRPENRNAPSRRRTDSYS